MKTKRKAKWEKKLTLTELKHLRGNTNGTLKNVKKTFRIQKEMRAIRKCEPCWDCRLIAIKLNEPI